MDGESEQDIAFIYPYNHAQIKIPKDLNGKKSAVVLEASHRNPTETLHWHLDNQYIGKTEGFHQHALVVDPGEYMLTLVDEQGQKASRRFEVVK